MKIGQLLRIKDFRATLLIFFSFGLPQTIGGAFIREGIYALLMLMQNGNVTNLINLLNMVL